MSNSSAPSMPDFNHIAATFDRFLPQVHPVSLALLDHLPAPAAGETILDVACGTGEPGLTLARRTAAIHILGIDRAAAMIAVAQGKATREALGNIRFEVMESETLALADQSMDGVISRFGLLMFGDILISARELARVLRVGGHFSLAVWDDMAKNTLMNTASMVLRDYLPKEHASPVAHMNEWAAAGRRTQLLKEVGLNAVHSEMFSWTYKFASFDAAWDLLSAMGNFTGHATLTPEVQQRVKPELEAAFSAYRQPAGDYVMPHACRLIWGQR